MGSSKSAKGKSSKKPKAAASPAEGSGGTPSEPSPTPHVAAPHASESCPKPSTAIAQCIQIVKTHLPKEGSSRAPSMSVPLREELLRLLQQVEKEFSPTPAVPPAALQGLEARMIDCFDALHKRIGDPPPPPVSNLPPIPPPASQRTPPAPRPPEEVTVRFPKKVKTELPISRATPASDVAERVRAAFRHVPTLASVQVRGVLWRANGDLAVRVNSESDADRVLRHGDSWRAHFVKGCEVPIKRWRVLIDGMPTSGGNPEDAGFISALVDQNMATLGSRDAVVDAGFYHRAAAHSGKAYSTIVLSLRTAELADRVICSDIAFNGALYSARKWVPHVCLCHHCQEPGHLAQACPHRQDPSARKCPRCAQPHTPREFRCANCGGAHKALDKRCPVLARARAAVYARFDNGTPYYNAQFEPSRARAGSV
ncbi:hypothetical protein EV714DRAFT_265755 [Schizophyllum commune]